MVESHAARKENARNLKKSHSNNGNSCSYIWFGSWHKMNVSLLEYIDEENKTSSNVSNQKSASGIYSV